MTLGTSASDLDSWEVSEGTSQIGDLEINGPKGLRSALATAWEDTEALAKMSESSDFSSDLLDPPVPFTNKKQVARPAGDSDKRANKARPATRKTKQGPNRR